MGSRRRRADRPGRATGVADVGAFMRSRDDARMCSLNNPIRSRAEIRAVFGVQHDQTGTMP